MAYNLYLSFETEMDIISGIPLTMSTQTTEIHIIDVNIRQHLNTKKLFFPYVNISTQRLDVESTQLESLALLL